MRHLIQEYGHDSRDTGMTWCGESDLRNVGEVAETTCPDCLKAIIRLGDEAKKQLDTVLGAVVSKIT